MGILFNTTEPKVRLHEFQSPRRPVLDEIQEARPSKEELRQVWGDFNIHLAQRHQGDKYFITLTHAEEPTYSQSVRAGDNFQRWCGVNGLHGIMVIEKGSLHGRLHHHALLMSEGVLWLQEAVENVMHLWETRYGFTKWSKARNQDECVRYCSKYLVKEWFSDWRYF
jgi:hypothetical protein